MKYNKLKEQTREYVINLQLELSNKNVSYSELVEMQEKLYKIGKRYGLLKEFKENGLL